MRVKCLNCKESFTPNWLEKRKPIEPIEPIATKNGGYWKRDGIRIKCPSCSENVNLPIPQSRFRPVDVCLSYGDEAYRDFKNQYFMTYTLVGSSEKKIEEVTKEVEKLKHTLLPNINPSDWNIHMKDMWSDRKKSKYFNDLSHEEIISFSHSLCKIIKKSGLNIFNVSSLYYKPKRTKEKKEVYKYVRNDCYMFLLMVSINQITGKNILPKLYFDSSGKDGWAKNTFLGGKLNLIYPFMTNSIDVEEPSYVKPASHLYLELADFISFLIARFVHQKVLNKAPELDTTLLGDIIYLGFDSRGNPKDIKIAGYPWAYFYDT